MNLSIVLGTALVLVGCGSTSSSSSLDEAASAGGTTGFIVNHVGMLNGAQVDVSLDGDVTKKQAADEAWFAENYVVADMFNYRDVAAYVGTAADLTSKTAFQGPVYETVAPYKAAAVRVRITAITLGDMAGQTNKFTVTARALVNTVSSENHAIGAWTEGSIHCDGDQAHGKRGIWYSEPGRKSGDFPDAAPSLGQDTVPLVAPDLDLSSCAGPLIVEFEARGQKVQFLNVVIGASEVVPVIGH